MKEKRNCGMNNYPVYPGPVMVPPMGLHRWNKLKYV